MPEQTLQEAIQAAMLRLKRMMAFSRSITVEEHEPLPLIDSMWWRFYR